MTLIINENVKTFKNDDIYIFTDGSAINNQAKDKSNIKAGVGVFFGDGDKRNISYSLNKKQNCLYCEYNDIKKKSNQVAEILAIIMAIETVIKTELIQTESAKKRSIVIYTDSMYCINSITKWGKNWENNNWKKSNGKLVDNLELIKKMYYLAKNLKVRMVHVNAHNAEQKKDDPLYFIWYGNMMADKLATTAANK